MPRASTIFLIFARSRLRRIIRFGLIVARFCSFFLLFTLIACVFFVGILRSMPCVRKHDSRKRLLCRKDDNLLGRLGFGFRTDRAELFREGFQESFEFDRIRRNFGLRRKRLIFDRNLVWNLKDII